MHRRSDNLLMIAARAPVPGETKTRLGRAIGMKQAAFLYRSFLVDLAARFAPDKAFSSFDIGWTHSPPEADFPAILTDVTDGGTDDDDVWFIPQEGPDWGVRQNNLLRWGHDHGYIRSILIASDSPHLTRSVLDDAFESLKDADVVIGRVRDGGYYLIGQRGYTDILSDVVMSTASAADGVIAQAISQGLRVIETPTTFDIDEVEDLGALIDELSPNGEIAPATWSALLQLGLIPLPVSSTLKA